MSFTELASHDGKAFAKLYAIYADMFPLADEREPPDAFYEILALNERTDIQTRLGPWREIVATARLWDGGPIVGGHVFGVTTSAAHIEFGCLASVQAIYTFLEDAARGLATIEEMKTYMARTARHIFGFTANEATRPPLIFFEVNNPLRMTPDEVASDTARSGLDPHRRYMFWRRCGFAPLDFAYVQPRLRPDAEPVRYLDLFCSQIDTTIPPVLLLNHLRAFIAISVLKGHPAEEDADFAAMASTLRSSTAIGFVPIDRDDQQKILVGARAAARAARGEASR